MTASLRVRRLAPEARLPTRAHPDDAGLDLRALSDVVLAPGARCAVRTGLAVQIPEDHFQGNEAIAARLPGLVHNPVPPWPISAMTS